MTSDRTRGGLRKRARPFTSVPNETVDDFTISFRALGILTSLLRKPDGWDVRAEQIANEGKFGEDHQSKREGREAVRSALRELALAGYYRLERCRLTRDKRQGQFVMVTSVSEDPVTSWAEQAEMYDGKAVPLHEQEDGSFLVKYPDGSLHPDDSDISDPGTNRTNPEDGFPGPGFPGPGEPGPGDTASGDTASGNTSPIEEELPKTSYKDSEPSPKVRRRPPPRRQKPPRPAAPEPVVQPTLDGDDDQPAAGPPPPEAVAFGIARAWIDYRAGQNAPVAGNNPMHQLKSLFVPFLTAGYTEDEIKRAINGLGEGIPSKAQMDRALAQIRMGNGHVSRTRRPSSVPDVNAAWADKAPQYAETAKPGAW